MVKYSASWHRILYVYRGRHIFIIQRTKDANEDDNEDEEDDHIIY